MAMRVNSLNDLPPELANRVTKSGKTVAQELLGESQQSAGKKQPNRANQGKEFEAMLQVSHDYYRLKRLGDIHRNENEWGYTTAANAHKISQTKAGKNMVAKTPAGSWLVMKRSMVDFAGGGTGYAARFDAKTVSKGDTIQLSRFKDHQVRESLVAHFCHYKIAGFMIWFAEYKRVFYVGALQISKLKDQFHGVKGVAGITISHLEEYGVEIPITNGMVDWMTPLIMGNYKL